MKIEKGESTFQNEFNPISLSVILLIIATIGSVLQISGTSWDVTSHLLQLPETFFTPSHTLLYSGIGLFAISATTALYLLYTNKEIRKMPFTMSFKLLIIGSVISLVAGPSDYLWHEMFGIDGLLSPTHLLLISGMLINSIALVLGLVRISTHLSAKKKTWVKSAMIPAFSAMWLTMIWYIYMFALPFSNGEQFNFNLHPIAESAIASIALPLISALVFVSASRNIGIYGAATVTAMLIGISAITNIIPANPLIQLLPWYLSLIMVAVIADLILNRSIVTTKLKSKIFGVEKSALVAGAMIGSIFYIMGYPMLPFPFAVQLGYQDFHPINDVLPIFVDTLPTVLPFTIINGALMGMIGCIISIKKIQSEPMVKYDDDAKVV